MRKHLEGIGESAMERFLSLFEFRPSGCWEWQGYTNNHGYGQFRPTKGDRRFAHRFSYELFRAPIPTGLVIDHLCRNPRCVNPDHLEPVTERENMLRGYSASGNNARKT